MILILSVSAISLLFCLPVFAEGWCGFPPVMYYEKSDGSRLADGLYTIDGRDWIFDKDGYLVMDKWIAWPDGTCSYCLWNGVIAKNQWVNKIYYVGESGAIDCMQLANNSVQQYNLDTLKNAFVDIEGESWDDSYGIQNSNEGGGCAGYIENGGWALYRDVYFSDGDAHTFIVNASALHEGGYIDLYLDSLNGELIGSCKIENTGAWEAWRDFSCDITNVSGVHDLYLHFRGNSGYLFDVNYFCFSGPGIRKLKSANSLTKADRYNDQYGVIGENDGYNIGYIKDGSWVLYKDMIFDPGTNYLAIDVSSLHDGGIIELHMDGLTEPMFGKCEAPGTGSWDTYKGLECWFSEIEGIHDLYLVFRGGAGYLMNVRQFIFLAMQPDS